MMATLAALVGVGIAKVVPGRSAEAASGDQMLVGNTAIFAGGQTAAHQTQISATVPAPNFGFRVSQAATTGGGIRGEVNNASNASPGLEGSSQIGVGLSGSSASGPGVFGFSQTSNGVVGRSGGNGAAMAGFTSNGIGLFGGVNAGGTGFAGWFDGQVRASSLTVSGNLQVNGDFAASGIKSAVIKADDGAYYRLYCTESPESIFEDHGGGQLDKGRTTIDIDPSFARFIRTDDYSVFVTPEGDCKGLFVTNKRPRSFDVQELGGGTSGVPFRWRLVAKRKDVEEKAQRLRRMTEREVKGPDKSHIRIPTEKDMPTPAELPQPIRPGGR
jgi:hypothetical protein